MRLLPALFVFGLSGAVYCYYQEQTGHPRPLRELASAAAEWISSFVGEMFHDSDEEAANSEQSEIAMEESTGAPTADRSEAEPLDLAEVFRFDVSPAQVSPTWNRIPAHPRDQRLRGYRVPLLTGTAPGDLTGSLAYYFDKERPRRITFTGSTADPLPLVTFLSREFGFRRLPSRGSTTASYASRTGITGELRIGPRTEAGRVPLDLHLVQ